ncbi:MAG: hypothetical protein JSR17_10800 [Proteobacteria bacterium]|nr:hypothetical protein [Pseudomonadota bacterium]
MSKKSSRIISILVMALVIMPTSVLATGSLGDAADNLMTPTSIVVKVVDIFCYLIGLGFVMMSIAQFKIHRQSPKLVPLGTPLILAILGIIALLIPYTTKLAETGKDEVPKDVKQSYLPLPGHEPKSSGLPFPPGHREQQQHSHPQQDQSNAIPLPGGSEQGAPADSSSTGGGGGWTTDPRYRQ